MTDKIEREKRVVEKMIRIFCRHHHNTASAELCDDCDRLLDYCRMRLDRCPKGELKSSCRKCEIHCYSPLMKQKIKAVMRYAGPRMILYHPADALRHMISELK